MPPKKGAAAPPPPPPPPSGGAGGGKGGGASEPGKRPPKGHKQRGAGAVMIDKGPQERGGVVVQSWQRVPSTLLSEYCQREKRPRPQYSPARGGAVQGGGGQGGGRRMQVLLPDPKSSDKSLRFVPCVGSEDDQVARENAALLALLHLMPSLPLERKLPEPYKTTWLQSVAAAKQQPPLPPKHTPTPTPTDSSKPKKTITPSAPRQQQQGGSEEEGGKAKEGGEREGPKAVVLSSALRFTSAKERNDFEEQRRMKHLHKDRERARKRRGRECHRLMLSPNMRTLLEDALGLAHDNGNQQEKDEEEEEDDEEDEGEEEEGGEGREAVIGAVVKMGFSVASVREAYRKVTRQQQGIGAESEAVLDWLVLHVREEELPARFDPRGKNMEVLKWGDSTDIGIGIGGTQGQRQRRHDDKWGLSERDEALLEARGLGGDRELQRAVAIAQAVYGAHWKVPEGISSGSGLEGMREEVETLAAILGSEAVSDMSVAVHEGHEWGHVSVTVTEGVRLRLWGGAGYPEEGGLPIALLEAQGQGGVVVTASMQRAMAARAVECRGQACLYDLTTHAQEILLLTQTHAQGEGPIHLIAEDQGGEEEGEEEEEEDGETTVAASSVSSVSISSKKPRQHCYLNRAGGFWSSGVVRDGAKDKALRLQELNKTNNNHTALQKMLRVRSSLPAASARASFLQAVTSHRVVIITGETGCGKTTQIPQFLLEWLDSEGRGSMAKVVVSQPRRLAAIGVAGRVAEERCESLGQGSSSVGYMIRGENKSGPHTRLLFCTTGIILRRLQESQGHALHTAGISHLVLDEVHERSLDSDLLLALLLRLLPLCPKLTVILMSATMDAHRLSRYFAPVCPNGSPLPPTLHLPGFTYPVTDLWLDDVMGPSLLHLPPTHPLHRNITQDKGKVALDYRLLVSLVKHVVCSESFAQQHPEASEGAILVFMPGVGEISRLVRDLQAAVPQAHVLPLHGGLSGRDQALVFKDGAPKGYSKKVVVSTNVAETSITIPDVTLVIDSARVKESGYDPLSRMACLVETWASQDSIRQRRGRAGRVRQGMAIHVTLTREGHDSLPVHSLPEVKRSPLEQTVLQLVAMQAQGGALFGDPRSFLCTLVDPPDALQVDAALSTLIASQAITPLPNTGTYSVTPLGRHLSCLPCPVVLGKMLVFGATLGVLRPCLSIAAGMLSRSPFLPTQHMEPDRKASVEGARRRLRGAALRSDHLVLAAIMESWDEAQGSRDRQALCNEVGLGWERMVEMGTLRRQLERDLDTLGFHQHSGADSALNMLTQLGEKGARGYWRLVRACVCLGLYPNVVKVKRPPPKYTHVLGGAFAKDHQARELRFYVRANTPVAGDKDEEEEEEGLEEEEAMRRKGQGEGSQQWQWALEERVVMHPASLNFTQGGFTVPWLVYHEVVRTSRAFLRDSTEACPYALLLAARSLKVEHPRHDHGHGTWGRIVLDGDEEGGGWVAFAAVGRIAALIRALKQRLDVLLDAKVADPDTDLAAAPEVRALVKLIATDGMG